GPSTPPAGASPLPLPGAPAAEAVAADETVEGSATVNITAPPALIGPRVVTVAEWLANVRAIAAPTAADPLEVVSPCAVVVAAAVLSTVLGTPWLVASEWPSAWTSVPAT